MKMGEVLTAVSSLFKRKSVGTVESGFLSRWNWARESWTGRTVTTQTALQNDTVWSCVRLISESVSTLPLGFYERTATGGRVMASDHRLYDLLHNEPNAKMSAVSYWQATVASMLLWGNGYTEISRDGGGRVVALQFLHPEGIKLGRDSAGFLTYEYTADGKTREIPRKNVMHFKAFTLEGEVGLSAIQFGVNSIGSALAADQAADETFRDSSRATGILTVDAVLKPGQRDEIRAHAKKVSDEGGMYVLEKGVGFSSIRFNPVDAELLASRSFSVETICRWFRTPPAMIGHGDKQSSWPTSTEQQNLLFLRYVLRACLLGVEQEIRRSLLTPAERLKYFAEFAIEGLLRGDSAARASFYSQMVNNGIMTRDEVRGLENLPPHGGNAAVLTVQSALLPIDKLGQQPQAAPDAAAREALKGWLVASEGST